ncbi:MobF family relaxase [uncultured Friedmanniella sp.]|uniref:MobF family relaxase n=1 Tax=uncultured Friedmanniella sp. TaxID=335381 RepID=UPI0035CB8801
MSLHKLTAGSGYDYLTRQVAVQDVTEKGHLGLASYYSERGEIPGVWIGAGCAGIRDDFAGSTVTAEQMQALFGAGLSPVGADNLAALPADATDREARAALRLGAPFSVSDREVSDFRIQVARRLGALNRTRGLPRDATVSVDDRARIRTEVATDFFTAEHGRPPADARELSAGIARHSRPRTTAVAGFDLTFSPPKSVSTLWAVAEPRLAARIERAHQQAVQTALRFIEAELLFSREGARGVRQVEVDGLVAAAFTHRDTRAGDPDLHTHVAIANKVRTTDSGKWLAVDGRVLYKGAVAASETYNTALVKSLEALGLQFYDRPAADPRSRPVREIVGVSQRLNERWSTRRADIEARRERLVTDFQARHGRPPSPVESIKLAQQATLETRDTKHEPRTLAEQRTVWHRQATETLGDNLGDDHRLQQMITGVFHRDQTPLSRADAGWFDHTADQMVGVMEQRGATWQDTHLRAEAQRRIRLADVTLDKTPAAVDHLVRLAKDRSVSLARVDPVNEPTLLRRSDGASVYTVHGAELFTSATVMAAEQAVLDLAERTDGRRLPTHIAQATVDEMAGSATPLTPGQEALVLALATSGRRLQLAIAPAGAGKTTAMHALTRAWTGGGGTVVGLAPSASAAAQLREQTGTTTDTLAKLAWSIRHGDLPPWAAEIGGRHLLIIDEAGMADTRSLATVSTWAADRGASIRLVGDDQQLAAIGAGGILRDLRQHSHTVQLTELMRFADPAESAATLALRAGQPSALGFYLDHRRVHVGDLTTITEQAFTAWDADRRQGRDSLMIAPTRAVVADLNRRARAQRLADNPTSPGQTTGGRNTPSQRREARLAGGNRASAGDIIITRRNDRRLRTSRTDWVKNGDRWTVRDVRGDGSLRVQHQTSRRILTLPRSYVADSVELGYACTIHSAQGVSVDTMHGVATGEESRQQLYTMLTRGRHANHLWLQTVSDGSPGTLIHPDGTHPPTPTDLLERILARDDTARSATTLAQEQQDPRLLLGDATQRYLDGLSVAAEQLAGPDLARAIDQHADRLLPGVSDEPAWPALRSHLLLLAAQDVDPIDALTTAVRREDLGSARDRAAVLVFRLDDTRLGTTSAAAPAPLPWLPPIPNRIAADPTFGPWLTARAELITGCADELRTQTASAAVPPGWSLAGARRLDGQLLADVEIWRAATQTDPDDLRPTGVAARTSAAAAWKRQVDQRLRLDRRPALQEWAPLLTELHPALANDPFTPQLADQLAAISRAGLPAANLLREAIGGPGSNLFPQTHGGNGRRPLPDDHAAAAVWWRITADLHRRYGGQPPAGERAIDGQGWLDRLQPLVGETRARELGDSPYWPLLVERIRDALDRGWPLDQLVVPAAEHPTMDACLALVCMIGATTEPPADAETAPAENPAPHDLHHGWTPDAPGTPATADISTAELWDQIAADVPANSKEAGEAVDAATDGYFGAGVEAQLHVAGMVRDSLGPPYLGDDEVRWMFDRADAWRDSPVSRHRMVQINQLTQAFFTRAFPGSWAQDYLIDRLNVDLTDHPVVLPGYAPDSWTGLVQHLRRLGVTDQEMLTAGVARTASTGGLIDTFRDRLMLPITHDAEILGFVGRRHPRHDLDLPSDRNNRTGGPKYLNTSETPLFHKGDQLYGDPGADALPVIVEGPLDAIAVSLGTGGRYIGLAPLGTALTDQQAALLAGRPVILATDADQAGDRAAERDFWRLAVHGVDPSRAILPAGTDPAAVLAGHGPDQLRAVLDNTRQQARAMIETRLAGEPRGQELEDVVSIMAARPRATWLADTAAVADALGLPEDAVRASLLRHVGAWNDNPRQAAALGLATTRLTAAPGPGTAASAHSTQPRAPSSRQDRVEPARTPAATTPGPHR